MLVIHPKDKSNFLAEAIYANIPNVHVVEDEWYERGIGQLLWQTPKEEPILIIGYGDCHGLYRERFNDVLEISPSNLGDPMWVHRLANCQIEVPQIVLNRIHAYNLRRHNSNIIGIWPNAVEFARRNRLHGLFASTFFFNAKDAENYGEITLDMYIERSNYTLYRTLGKLLASHVPLYKIPKILQQRAYKDTSVNHRNFESFFCL